MTSPRRSNSFALYLLFFLSGAAALGYQLIWSKIFAVGLGHEMASVLAVVCAFMGGMSVGAWIADRPVQLEPMRLLAVIETIIAVWGAVTAVIVPSVNSFALHVAGLESPRRQWIVCFALPFLVLLPATLAMGASFPAMERCIADLKGSGQHVPRVYAINTFGAVAGTYLSIFVIAPQFGLRSTFFCLAVINLFCAASAFALSMMQRNPSKSLRLDSSPRIDSRSSSSSTASGFTKRRLLVTLFFTGLFGMAIETVGVRVLSQVLENTVYSFAAVLSVFLLAVGAGAAVVHRLARAPSQRLLSGVLCGLGLASLLTVVLLHQTPNIYEFAREHFSGSAFTMVGAEMLVAIVAFGIPALLMGAAFSLLAQAWRSLQGSVALAAAINTAGAAFGPILFSVIVLPSLGAKWAFLLLSVGYFCLLPALHKLALISFAIAVLTTFMLPRDLHLLHLASQDTVRDYRDGIMASVAVVEDPTRHRTLRINNHFQMGGTGASDAEYRHAHIPLLLHPHPIRALILGLGTGITLGGATIHPDIKVDGVELLPEVIDVLPQFEPYNRNPQHNHSVQLYTADARRFIKLTQQKYDVIIADLFHPAADGAGNLYTQEHFRSIREHLDTNGLFCQWLPLHQLDLPMFRVITKTFLEVFPNTHAWLLRFNVDAPVVGLIGSPSTRQFPTNWIEQRLAANPAEPEIKRLSLADSIRFFGNYLAAPAQLSSFCDDASINTDDQAVVLFRAPAFAYQKRETSYGRLVALLRQFKPDASAIFEAGSHQFVVRLNAYFAARSVYIDGLIDEAEDRPDQAVDKFVESARLSEDFTPGYAQCLTLASVEAHSNPTRARRLLERLIEAQPSRPVAREMLNRLFGAQE